MTRTLNYAFATVVACSLTAFLVAQGGDSFPDTPANHWAFEALARLKKDGILVGYPDGLYRGGRPASRYELAAAVHSAYLNLKNRSDGLSTQAQSLNDKIAAMNGVSKADLDALKASLAATQAQVDGMKGYRDDIDGLKKMADEFQKELSAMGVDIEGVKKDLNSLDSRVTALEKRKLPVDIRGTVDTLMLGGYSSGNVFGVTVDGRPTGVGRGAYGPTSSDLDTAAHVGITRDLTVMHEISLTLTDNLHADPNWRVVAVTGNMLGSGTDSSSHIGFGSQSAPSPSIPFSEAPQSLYIQNASAKFEGKISSFPYRVEMGRFDHRITPYTFQRPDTTPYFVNDRWDNGAWGMDGGVVKFGTGAKTVNFFVGRTGTSTTVDPLFPQLMTAGSAQPLYIDRERPVGLTGGTVLPINNVIGADMHLPLLKNGEFTMAYVMLKSDTIDHSFGFGLNEGANGVNVFGASFHVTVAGFIPLHGSFAKTNIVHNGTTLISRDNNAIELGISGKKGALGLDAGYREIGPNFGAPGDWGRIGMWWNPTNIKDIFVTPSISAGSWVLGATTHFTSGLGKAGEGPDFTDGGSPLGPDDHDNNVAFTLTHKMAGGTQALIGMESADWKLKDRGDFGFQGGTPKERWYDFGLSMSKQNSTFSILYQISDYSSNGVNGWQPFGFNGNFSEQTTAHGGLVTTQFTSKF